MATDTRILVSAYVGIAVLTFLYQIWIRVGQCEGLANCALSFAKGAIWSVIWPAYWVMYLIGQLR